MTDKRTLTHTIVYEPDTPLWYRVSWLERGPVGKLDRQHSYHITYNDAKTQADVLFIQPGIKGVIVSKVEQSDE